MSRRPPYRLIDETFSDDTIEALRELLQFAEAGEVVGIAFAAMFKRRKFVTDAAGECRRNPVFTRGMVAALDDCLAERMRANN
jgi:hypothetical protein